MATTATTHRTGTRAQWQAAHAELLEREKEHARMGDDLARRRRSLPWVPVEKEYTLHTADGPTPLAQLFAGRSQLLIYHFMFGPATRPAHRLHPRGRGHLPDLLDDRSRGGVPDALLRDP